MTNAIKRNGNSKRRSATGSLLVEGTVATVIFLAVAVPVIIFFTNLSFQMLYQSEISAVASNLASYASAQNTWLGLPVPGTSATPNTADVQARAQQLCSKLNINNVSATVTADDSDPNSTVYTVDLTANMAVPFRASIFGFDMARFFPGTVSARGVAAAAKTQPYAMVLMDGQVITDPANKTSNGQRVVACVPAFGFRQDPSSGSNPQASINGVALGTPYKSLLPQNCISINNYGLQKSDLDYMNANPNAQVFPAYWNPSVVASSGTNGYSN